MITRCKTENIWRGIIIENPQTVLDRKYSLDPKILKDPSKFLKEVFKTPDKMTSNIIAYLNKDFFESQFKTGTMIIVENFQATNYEQYFSVNSINESYLYNYVQFYTAHGDIRLIKKEHGFSSTDIKTVTSHLKEHKCSLKL